MRHRRFVWTIRPERSIKPFNAGKAVSNVAVSAQCADHSISHRADLHPDGGTEKRAAQPRIGVFRKHPAVHSGSVFAKIVQSADDDDPKTHSAVL